MQTIVHREVYHNPVERIAVPETFKNQSFEVLFIPLVAQPFESENNQNQTSDKLGLGNQMASLFANIDPAQTKEQDFVLPKRELDNQIIEL